MREERMKGILRGEEIVLLAGGAPYIPQLDSPLQRGREGEGRGKMKGDNPSGDPI
jgi:hypothetical protein